MGETMAEVAVNNTGQLISVTQPASKGVSAPEITTTAEIVKAIPPPTIQLKESVVARIVAVIKSSKNKSSIEETKLGMIAIATNPGKGRGHPGNGRGHPDSGQNLPQKGVMRNAIVAGPAPEVPIATSLPQEQRPNMLAETITQSHIVIKDENTQMRNVKGILIVSKTITEPKSQIRLRLASADVVDLGPVIAQI